MVRKMQSAVEDIFKDVNANNDVVYTKECSSSEDPYDQTLKKKKLLRTKTIILN